MKINKAAPDGKPLFGTMNANQMICLPTDQLRLAIGTIKLLEYGNYEAMFFIDHSKAGKTIPVPKGLVQVEGSGTEPTDFENDRENLKLNLLKFSIFLELRKFGPHPYIGTINKKRWTQISMPHFDHHLKPFNA